MRLSQQEMLDDAAKENGTTKPESVPVVDVQLASLEGFISVGVAPVMRVVGSTVTGVRSATIVSRLFGGPPS